MSGDDFKIAKEGAIKNEQRFANLSLHDIAIVKNTFTDNILDIKGKPVSVSKAFLNDFLNACGMGHIANEFKRMENSEISAQLLNTLRSAQRSNDTQYKMIVNPNNEVSRLVSTSVARISNKCAFDIAETIANKYGLDIIDAISENSGNSKITLLSDKQINVLSGTNEIHKFGLTISNKDGQTSISNFAMRLVCTNGMETIDNYNEFCLGGITPNELTNLFNHILRMKNENYIPQGFFELVEKAKHTQASMRETETVINSIFGKLGYDKENPDYQLLRNKFIVRFFPEYAMRVREITAKGNDFSKFGIQQKSYIHCGSTSVWDLVNVLTNFGSNNLGMKIQTPKGLQIEGGKLLQSTHDLNGDMLLLLKL